MISYSYKKELNLFHVTIPKEIHKEDYFQFMFELHSNYFHLNEIRLLLDYKDVTHKIEISHESEEILNKSLEYLNHYSIIKIAALVDKHESEMITMFYQQLAKGKDNYHYQVFKERAGALRWLTS